MDKTTASWDTLKTFATDYLMPVAALIAVMVVGLGLVALGGLFFAIAAPIALIFAVLIACLYLTTDLSWRISVLDALIGVGATILSLPGLVTVPILTILGAVVGAAIALGLYLANDPGRAYETYEKAIDTLTVRGETYRVMRIAETGWTQQVILGGIGGLVLSVLCWFLPVLGLWNVFVAFVAGLALGRSMSWFALEGDRDLMIFWRPTPFLADVPVLKIIFDWIRHIRTLAGLSLAHWAL